ncbi:MAG: hypothetical protein JWQ98_345 [Chlorobi bacterium]|nr:hypothetical protein [Chlorobiota bacterium]
MASRILSCKNYGCKIGEGQNKVSGCSVGAYRKSDMELKEV